MVDGTARILVVDNDLGTRALLGALLQGFGFEVGYANDGMSAAGKCESFNPEVVLFEEQTPKQNLFSLYRAMKDKDRLPRMIRFGNHRLRPVLEKWKDAGKSQPGPSLFNWLSPRM